MSHSDCTTDAPFDIRRVIAFVTEFFLTNLLHLNILCGDDAKSATIHGIVGLCFCISHLVHEIFDNFICHSIYKIGADRSTVLVLGIGSLNPFIYRIGKRLIILCLIDISLFFHIIENLFAALRILVRVSDRVIFSRVLCDCSNRRTF